MKYIYLFIYWLAVKLCYSTLIKNDKNLQLFVLICCIITVWINIEAYSNKENLAIYFSFSTIYIWDYKFKTKFIEKVFKLLKWSIENIFKYSFKMVIQIIYPFLILYICNITLFESVLKAQKNKVILSYKTLR